MTDQLGPSFDRRLRTELDRFSPPTPRPESARYNRIPPGYGRLSFLKPAVAVAAALALVAVGPPAASGSPEPVLLEARCATTSLSGDQNPAARPATQPTMASPLTTSHAGPTPHSRGPAA